jgi:hypothetical protein
MINSRIIYLIDAEELLLDALKLRTMISQVQRNQTLIVKLNNMGYLDTHAFDFKEEVNTWLQAKQNTTTIYENGVVEPNFECIPSSLSCNSLLIRKVTKDRLGQYVKIGKSDDKTRFTFTSYTLAAFETKPDGYCVSDNTSCTYDNPTNILKIKENENVTLHCSYYIWQSIDDKIDNLPVEIDFPLEFGHDCIFKPVLKYHDYTDPVTNAKRILVTKECSRSFERHDNRFKCMLVNTNDKKTNDEIISDVEVKVDVHYENDEIDHEVDVLKSINTDDEQVSLICPFEGNPIQYYWKNNSSNSETEGDQVNVLSKFKSSGLFHYECRAYIGGLVNKWTDRINYTIEVQKILVKQG